MLPVRSAYIHIPFCLSRCIYCDFAVVLSKHGGQEAYLNALCQEISACFESHVGPPVVLDTLYLGGGTPNTLPASWYHILFTHLQRYVTLSSACEITMECNPLASPMSSWQDYRALGINRLSIGVQSFNDPMLRILSRNHTADEALSFVKQSQKSISNVSIDLMYGLPTRGSVGLAQQQQAWQETCMLACQLNLSHVSLYGLHIEAQTPLEKLIQLPQAMYSASTDDATADQYLWAIDQFDACGLKRYEISNCAQPGYESRHNLAYWRNQPFYGFGLGATGYYNQCRRTQTRQFQHYLNHPTQYACIEPVSAQEAWENSLIFGLRLVSGVSLPEIEQDHGRVFLQDYPDFLPRFSPRWVQWQPSTQQLQLTAEGMLLSNDILSTIIK